MTRPVPLWLLLLAGLAGAPGALADEITPPDVFVHVARLRAELELIRLETGRPVAPERAISIRNAAPREVYFQALTLYRLTDRLAFEYTRSREAREFATPGEPAPPDVFEVVDAALARMREVRSALAIPERAPLPERDADRTPTDVFLAILDANRQLDLLLDRPLAPADVFEQLTLAVGYASKILKTIPGAIPLPDAPAPVRRRRPADLQERLLDCFRILARVANRSGFATLEIVPSRREAERIAPSDVYATASLIVSELAFLHARRPGVEPPRPVYPPGKKTPADAYRRAGVLLAQLEQIEPFSAARPDWLAEAVAHR